MTAAIRDLDMHECYTSTGSFAHVGGTISSHTRSVGVVDGRLVCVGDTTTCQTGELGTVITGARTVMAEGRRVARHGDSQSHGGSLRSLQKSVYVGSEWWAPGLRYATIEAIPFARRR